MQIGVLRVENLLKGEATLDKERLQSRELIDTTKVLLPHI
jgi:hypothetical protein